MKGSRENLLKKILLVDSDVELIKVAIEKVLGESTPRTILMPG